MIPWYEALFGGDARQSAGAPTPLTEYASQQAKTRTEPARIPSQRPSWATTLFGDPAREYQIEGTDGQQFRSRNALASGLQSLLQPGAGSYGQRLLRAGASSVLGGLQADNQLEGMERAQLAQRRAESRDDRQIAQGDRRIDLVESGQDQQADQFDQRMGFQRDQFGFQQEQANRNFGLQTRQVDAGIANQQAQTGIAEGRLGLARDQFGFQQEQAAAAQQRAQAMFQAGILNKDQSENFLKLSDRYTKETADFKGKLNAVQNLESQMALGSREGDVAGLFTFIKALDPASTVREGEIELATSTLFPARLREIVGAFNSRGGENGGYLTAGERQGLLQAASSTVENDQAAVSKIQDRYRSQAGAMGVPARVVDDALFGAGLDYSAVGSKAQRANAQEADPDEAAAEDILNHVLDGRL